MSGRAPSISVLTLERLALDPVPDGEFSAPTDIVVPIVDGTPLGERLGGDLYPGVGVGRVAPPSKHRLGEPPYEDNGRAVLLDGFCGIAGCCGLMACITVTDEHVRWDDVFTRGPDLPRDLSFTFGRADYEAALRSILDLVPRLWSLPDHDER